MAGAPFLGRLFLREYIALIGSLILIGLEIIARVVTLALPERILLFLYYRSRVIFNYLSSPQSQKSRAKKRSIVNPIAQAHDFVDLCELAGYSAEEHVVQTEDGYLLGVHRLAWRRGEEDKQVNAGEGSLQKKVVYMHHGLMMNSEVWVCLTEEERCLPFQLVERGFDVWLGNNRGNKYSKKSTRHSPTSVAFWNFSIDEFAFHDIPDTIAYVLSTTGKSSLAYVGFSQGTAQAFATLSIHPTLNEKVDVFIALAPAMSPPGLANGIVASLVKTSPEILYLAFGRRSILNSATMWQALLYPPIFTRVIDISLSFLFGWHTKNITPHQKLAAYPHLFSFSSTKSVVHWFQIIRNGVFQMFDDEVQSPLSISDGSRYYKVAKFPTRNIRTPVVLVYGGSDSLVDINIMLKELPKHTVAKEIPKYEHLDFLWASDVDKLVFPYVFESLNQHASSGLDDKTLKASSQNGHTLGVPRRTSIHHTQQQPAVYINGVSDSSALSTPPPEPEDAKPSRTQPPRPLAFSSPSFYLARGNLHTSTSSSNLNAKFSMQPMKTRRASQPLPSRSVDSPRSPKSPQEDENLQSPNSPPAAAAEDEQQQPSPLSPSSPPLSPESPTTTEPPSSRQETNNHNINTLHPPNPTPQSTKSTSSNSTITSPKLPPTSPTSAPANNHTPLPPLNTNTTSHPFPSSATTKNHYKRRRQSPSRQSGSSVSSAEPRSEMRVEPRVQVGKRGIEIKGGRAVVGGEL